MSNDVIRSIYKHQKLDCKEIMKNEELKELMCDYYFILTNMFCKRSIWTVGNDELQINLSQDEKNYKAICQKALKDEAIQIFIKIEYQKYDDKDKCDMIFNKLSREYREIIEKEIERKYMKKYSPGLFSNIYHDDKCIYLGWNEWCLCDVPKELKYRNINSRFYIPCLLENLYYKIPSCNTIFIYVFGKYSTQMLLLHCLSCGQNSTRIIYYPVSNPKLKGKVYRIYCSKCQKHKSQEVIRVYEN